MKLKTAIRLLELYNKWRTGDEYQKMIKPEKITKALDLVISEVKVWNEVRNDFILILDAKYCPFCGKEKEFINSTDVNSGRVCKNVLCHNKK